MSRSIIIFGNGLGMSLDPDYFELQSGLEYVWNSNDYLSDVHKELILSAISDTTEKIPPSSEEQLDKLQIAIIATEFLCSFEISGTSWVSDAAKELPSAFRKYIHEVAYYFHRSEKFLPREFIDPLSEYIKQTKSHIITLNYDNLLYDSLKDCKVLDGYNGPLIDGFWGKSGFNEENLDRHYPENQGWYLHLHGSPLYIGNNKIMGMGREYLDPDEKNHIVLTHVEHKPIIIESSNILSAYWRRLEKALDESEKIILFGYSGLDTHLNNRIKLRNDKTILVVEWCGSGEFNEREKFWKDSLKTNYIELVQLENIFEFFNW